MLQSALRVNRAMTALSIQLGNDGQSAMPSLEENDWATAKNCLLILEPFNQGILKLIKNLFIKYNCFVVATIDLSRDYFWCFWSIEYGFFVAGRTFKNMLIKSVIKKLVASNKINASKI
jgi:hypothetical protein